MHIYYHTYKYNMIHARYRHIDTDTVLYVYVCVYICMYDLYEVSVIYIPQFSDCIYHLIGAVVHTVTYGSADGCSRPEIIKGVFLNTKCAF